ncbi:unnamed protein product, partial [Ascophyllum nodosum]
MFLSFHLFWTSDYTFRYNIPRLPTHGHDRPCRRDVGRVFLAGVRPDSPFGEGFLLLLPRPWSRCSGRDGS